MAHLLVLIQPALPESVAKDMVNKFIEYIEIKTYSATKLHPTWNKIRPREIRIFDLQIPEKIENEVLADLLPFERHRMMELPKLLKNKTLLNIAKKIFKIEEINRDIKFNQPIKDFPIRLAILGKIKDIKIDNVEQL